MMGSTQRPGHARGGPVHGPWGKKRTSSGEDPRFEFQGDRRDEDTGLVDMGAAVNRIHPPLQDYGPLTGSMNVWFTPIGSVTYGVDALGQSANTAST